MKNNPEQLFLQARVIAVDNLKQCFHDGKMLASLKNFSDYWARDTFWAIPGILETGNSDVALESLEYFLQYQLKNGKIPRKIALDYNGIKYLTGKSIKRKTPSPVYSGNFPPFSSMDGNALFVIACGAYIAKTGDANFIRLHYSKIKSAIDWYEHKLRGGFVSEYALGNWMDTIFKNGAVLYTNVVYAEALKSFAHIAEVALWQDDCAVYTEKHKNLRNKIEEEFWNGKFFDDQLGKHAHFDVAGNVLALYFGISSEEKVKIIFQKLVELHKNKLLLPTVAPKYPWWKVNPVTYLFGMQDYHNGISWSWIDMFFAGALFKNNSKEKSFEMFEDICFVIVKNGAVHETYFNDGIPFEARLWESAVPFAWGSGVFLKIYAEIFMKSIDNEKI